MSSVIQGLFGGSNNSYSSSNQAYPYLQGALSGNVSNGSNAGSEIANLLGLNGAGAQGTGFANWKNSTGYQSGLNQGIQSITGNAATQGLLNSGSTLKAIDTYGQNYANTQYGNYMSQLQQLLGAGNQSAGIIGGAGNVSQGNGSSSTGNLGGFLGGSGSSLGTLLNKGGGGGSAAAFLGG